MKLIKSRTIWGHWVFPSKNKLVKFLIGFWFLKQVHHHMLRLHHLTHCVFDARMSDFINKLMPLMVDDIPNSKYPLSSWLLLEYPGFLSPQNSTQKHPKTISSWKFPLVLVGAGGFLQKDRIRVLSIIVTPFQWRSSFLVLVLFSFLGIH